jgi:hypothetical protein
VVREPPQRGDRQSARRGRTAIGGAAGARALRLAGWVALALAAAAAAGALLPLPPQLLANDLDAGFAATLHFAAAHRSAVGTRLISTFGPLGFVFYSAYAPATFAWLLGLRALLAAATCAALAWIGYAAWASPWGAVVALLVCAPFLAPPDVWFLIVPLLLLLVDLAADRPAPAWLRVALGAAVGLASLIKFTFLLAALAVLVPQSVAALLSRRRVPLPAVVAPLAAAVAWLATGHGAADLLPYLDWSVRDISSGYASAMQLPTTPLLVAHAAAVSLSVLAAAALLARRRMPNGRWAAHVAAASIVCLLFKAGFVRADVHVFITCFGLLVIAMLIALSWGRRPSELAVAAVLVALLPGGLWAHAVAVEGAPIMYFPPVFPAQAIRRLAAAPMMLADDGLARAQARRAAGIRAAYPLPPLRGPVDVYSYDQAVLLAHGLDFQPRPVFQSYMAYTPRLARANADFLLGERAPEEILFRVAPIDARLPALDDAASWPLLMARYRFVERAGGFALLQRRAAPLPWRLEPLARVETVTDQLIEVPSADGPIWARVDLHATRRDAIVETLLAAPPAYISIVRHEGTARAYRIVPALARDGFVLSPLVENTADFIRLLSNAADGPQANAADAFVISVRDPLGLAPQPRAVTVELFRLRVGE